MKSLNEVRPARIERAFFVTLTFYTSERSFRFVPAILLQCATIDTNLFLLFRVSDPNRFNKTRIKHSLKSLKASEYTRLWAFKTASVFGSKVNFSSVIVSRYV